MTGKLGLRNVSYPFDFSRVTLDGIIHFTRRGFREGFFPPGDPPYRAECVGPWVLFRGRHTAFAHFDLNDPRTREAFSRKFERWEALMRGDCGPVVFMRTVTARNPKEELRLFGELEEALKECAPRLDYRIAAAVHDQGVNVGGDIIGGGALEFERISPRCRLFVVEYSREDPAASLFDRCQKGYTAVVSSVLDEDSWKVSDGRAPDVWVRQEDGNSAQTVGSLAEFPWRSHNNLALIDGVASVGGTCIGVHSTKYDEKCPFCGDASYHKAGRPARTDRPFTQEEDDVLLAQLYNILTGGDKVEAVERLADELRRGAFEVICRLQFLTNNSVKITESDSASD